MTNTDYDYCQILIGKMKEAIDILQNQLNSIDKVIKALEKETGNV